MTILCPRLVPCQSLIQIFKGSIRHGKEVEPQLCHISELRTWFKQENWSFIKPFCTWGWRQNMKMNKWQLSWCSSICTLEMTVIGYFRDNDSPWFTNLNYVDLKSVYLVCSDYPGMMKSLSGQTRWHGDAQLSASNQTGSSGPPPFWTLNCWCSIAATDSSPSSLDMLHHFEAETYLFAMLVTSAKLTCLDQTMTRLCRSWWRTT